MVVVGWVVGWVGRQCRRAHGSHRAEQKQTEKQGAAAAAWHRPAEIVLLAPAPVGHRMHSVLSHPSPAPAMGIASGGDREKPWKPHTTLAALSGAARCETASTPGNCSGDSAG